MFSFQISDAHELRLLRPSDADEFFGLIDANRAYLRTWLPWLDGTVSAANTEDFIRSTLQQFADNPTKIIVQNPDRTPSFNLIISVGK